MDINVENQITLDKFVLRWYQKPFFDAIESDKHRKLILIAPRRSGKDILCWNAAIRQCLKKTCIVYYCLPTYSQARKTIFDAITIDSTLFLDYIPKQLIASVNSQEMKIRFINNSILQCIGADSYDTSLVGTNPYMIVFSEYSRMTPKVWDFARPILAASGGKAIFVSTPYGKNHFWFLMKMAEELPDWKVFKMTTSEIQHVPEEVLQQERAQMDEGLYLQEYECSFERGISGNFYGTYLDSIRSSGQIGPVAWEPGLLTYSAWDIGINDATSIIFWQQTGDGTIIRIIDYLSNTGVGLDWYAKRLQDKPYRYGGHFAPFDIRVREWGGGGVTRFEKAQQLGIEFTVLEQLGVIEGIENVWTHFNKFWIDETKCRSLINAIENYRREWDDVKQIYSNKPLHNWSSNGCDALRYMCQAIHKTKRGLTSEEFERKRNEALYGNSGIPRQFQQNPYWDNLR